MNQWLAAFLILWLGTGLEVVLFEWASAYKEKCKRGNR